MTRRTLTLAIIWLTMCGAAFVTLVSTDNDVEMLGFVMLLLTLQAPAFLAVSGAAYDRPLELGRAITVGFLGAIANAYTTMPLGSWVFAPVFVVVGIGAPLVLRLVPHPRGGRIVFTAMLGLAAVSAGGLALEGLDDRMFYAVVACGVPWSLPLFVLCWWPRPATAPIARVVR